MPKPNARISNAKDQSPNITPKKKPEARSVIPYQHREEYRDLFDSKRRLAPLSFIERLSEQLIQWAMKDKEALILRDFFHLKGIPYNTVTEWIKKYEVLSRALNEAKLMIGSRREKRTLKREFEPGTFKASQHHYDPRWKADEIWRAKLRVRQEKAKALNNTCWVLEKFARTDIVPEKNDEEGGEDE